MQTPLQQAIREQLRVYLAREQSLREFHEWFVPATLDVDDSGDPAAIDLTYDIILWLAEYSYGHRSEDNLRELFRSLAAVPAASATA